MPTLYLAGPDVFRPDAETHFERVRAACAKAGFEPLVPLADATTAQQIFLANLQLIKEADLVLANLEPFRGAEPDSGTVWEIGYAFALGKSCFGFRQKPGSTLRIAEQHYPPVSRSDRRPVDRDGNLIEDFGLPVNLMLHGGLEQIYFGPIETALSGIMRDGWRGR